MAATVAAPLERRLGEIAGVTELTSVSSLGSSRITIQFDLSRNIDGAARDVQAALNAALSDLPGDLPTLPTFRKSNPAAAPILILALTSKTMLPSEIYDAADTVIAQRLSQVDGVADVTVTGAEQPAIRVRVDPTRLASMGLSTGGRAHARSPTPMRSGRSERSTASAPSPSASAISSRDADDYDPLVVKTVNGTVIRLSDVATIAPRRAQQPLGRLVQPRPFGAADHHQAGQCQCHRHGRPYLRRCCRSCANGCRPA